MSNTETVWSAEPHTIAKHEILRRYLDAWLPIMGRSYPRLLIMDGFAGPGEYTNGLDGSPIIALNSLTNHTNNSTHCEYIFLFNEADPARYANLTRVLASRQDADHIEIYVENKSFTDAVESLLGNIGDSALAPLFAFVDPFGYSGIPMATLRDLFRFDKSELLIYLDLNSLIRFATAGNVDSRFTDLYGTTEYQSAPATGPERRAYLVELYEKQLKEVCGFKYTRGFVMFGENNKPVCCLVYATRHPKGMDVMKNAMWKVDPTGSFSFSDSYAGMETLLEKEPDLAPLAKEVRQHFKGKSVTVQDVEVFVYTKTPYKKDHTRGALRIIEGEVPLEVELAPGIDRKRRRRTYPSGSRITFP